MKFKILLAATSLITSFAIQANADVDDDLSQVFFREFDNDMVEHVQVWGDRGIGDYTDGSGTAQAMRASQDRSGGSEGGGIIGTSVKPVVEQEAAITLQEDGYDMKEVAADILGANNAIIVGTLVAGYALTFPISGPMTFSVVVVSSMATTIGTRIILEAGGF
jgi:hypothetical protein